MDLISIIKERIKDLEAKLDTAVNQKAVRDAIEHNKKLLEDMVKKK